MKLIYHARKLEQKTRLTILSHARKLEGKIQERLQGTHVGEEPLEVWRRIAREIESQIQPVKSGRIFPHSQISLTICPSSTANRAALRVAFEAARFEEAVRQLLQDEECETPHEVWATVKFAVQPGKDWENPVYHVRYSDRVKAVAPPSRPARVKATLRITRGRATQSTYTLSKDVTYMGRGLATAASTASHRNDVVFEDCEDPVNSTVSRKHARIVYEEDNQSYVLYDERSARGTSLLRAGRTSKLAEGSRGRRLADGDQILLGKAVIEFGCPPS